MQDQSSTRTAVIFLLAAVAILHIAQEVLIPISLAVLLSFFLAPVVLWMERFRYINRVGAVIITTLMTGVVIAALGALMFAQAIDLANHLPSYKSNVLAKIEAIKGTGRGPIAKVQETIRDVAKELSPAVGPSTSPASTNAEVTVVKQPDSPLGIIASFVAPVFAPLGMALVVVVFVIFLLLEREDLRDRIIHLVGRGRLRLTTQALDEATQRVSRYLFAQVLVNCCYGIFIAIGLWAIGIPNSLLWGLIAAVLRFIPYVGPWLGAAFPLLLSLAISTSWAVPVLTFALYGGGELVTANVIEPWLYGSSTGLSPVAIIIAAVFWAWIWGPVGLVLATPLTVCMSVLGRYIPGMEFLDVLIGEHPKIASEERFYQRLLARDTEEATEIAEEYAAKHSLEETYDIVLLPALALVERDVQTGELDSELRRLIFETVRELIATLGKMYDAKTTTPAGRQKKIWCVPVHDEADEIAGEMLATLCKGAGLHVEILSSRALVAEVLQQVDQKQQGLIAISAVPPAATMPAIYLCKRLREQFSSLPVIVGLWRDNQPKRRERLEDAGANKICITLRDTVAALKSQAVVG